VDLYNAIKDVDDLERTGPVSLAIAFKGPEGIVLAADSRVTLMSQQTGSGGENIMVPATFDNATKLLHVRNLSHVGAVTYGLGAIGGTEPRTAHSFLPELEAILGKKAEKKKSQISTEDFAKELSEFFVKQWDGAVSALSKTPDMFFLVGGFDKEKAYGRVYQFAIPSEPSPREQIPDDFGVTWGGQNQYVNRLLTGFDPNLPSLVEEAIGLEQGKKMELERYLQQKLSAPIPYQFLPLQDCVNLAIFLIRATIKMQTWTVDVRGVGGAIDVATITRTEGFVEVQKKEIVGEKEGS
jgi:hypothetical protein